MSGTWSMFAPCCHTTCQHNFLDYFRFLRLLMAPQRFKIDQPDVLKMDRTDFWKHPCQPARDDTSWDLCLLHAPRRGQIVMWEVPESGPSLSQWTAPVPSKPSSPQAVPAASAETKKLEPKPKEPEPEPEMARAPSGQMWGWVCKQARAPEMEAAETIPLPPRSPRFRSLGPRGERLQRATTKGPGSRGSEAGPGGGQAGVLGGKRTRAAR